MTAHRSDADLRAYHLGALGQDEALAVESHVAACAACEDRLERLEREADELVAGLRRAAESPVAALAPGVERLIGRVGKLGSTHSLRQGDTSRDAGQFELASGWSARFPGAEAEVVEPLQGMPAAGPLPASADELLAVMRQIGVLSRNEGQTLRTEAPADALADSISFARWLVERQRLTCYQAAELCLGRGEGLLLGGNLILDEIGRGGMGQVFRARNVRMNRLVAIKLIAPHLFSHAGSRERFRRETRAIAALSHPHVLTAYDAGECSRGEYLVMEYATAGDLGRHVRATGPLGWQRAAHYIQQAAAGLAAAHEQGLVHRDVKPSNLMAFANGTIKVADLGLARFLASTETGDNLTTAGQVMGTLDYMSPEQAFQPESVDGRADIYSLGWTVFHLVTGAVPYGDATGLAKLRMHREGPIPSLRESVSRGGSVPQQDGLAGAPEVPESLDQLFRRMVAKDPAERPGTMREVTETLAALLPNPVEASLPADAAEAPSGNHSTFFRELATRVEAARAAEQAVRMSQPAQPQPAARPRRVARRFWLVGGVLGCAALATIAGAFFIRSSPSPNERPVAGAAHRAVGDADQIPRQTERPRTERPAGYPPASSAPGTDPSTPRAMENPTVNPPREDTPPVVDPPEPRDQLYGQIAQLRLPQRVVALALSPDKRTAYAASSDKNVYVLNVAEMSVAGRLSGHQAPVNDLAVSPDGSQLATCGGDRTIRVWDLADGKTINVFRLPVPAYRIAIAPDGRSLLAALMVTAPPFRRPDIPPEYRDFRSLMLLDIESGKIVRPLTDDRETFYWSLAFSPDGRYVAAGSQDGIIRLIDLVEEQGERTISNRPGPTHDLLFTPDSQRLYAGNALLIQCYQVPTGQVLYRYGLRHAIKGIDVTSDEKRLLAEGTIDVRIVDAERPGPEAVTNLHGHESPISGLRFLADESVAISSAWDGTVRLWQLPPR